MHITPYTWFFLATLLLTIFGYYRFEFIFYRKIILFYFKKNKRWAMNEAVKLDNKVKENNLKCRAKRKAQAIERADLIAKTTRLTVYVMPEGEDFVIRDTITVKDWMKQHHVPDYILPTQKCVYYTQKKLLTES